MYSLYYKQRKYTYLLWPPASQSTASFYFLKNRQDRSLAGHTSRGVSEFKSLCTCWAWKNIFWKSQFFQYIMSVFKIIRVLLNFDFLNNFDGSVDNLVGLVKVSYFQNVLLVSSFGPKYQFEKWSNHKVKALYNVFNTLNSPYNHM